MLFPTSLKARINLLKHILDGQIGFKLNSLFSGKKNGAPRGCYSLAIYHQGKKKKKTVSNCKYQIFLKKKD